MERALNQLYGATTFSTMGLFATLGMNDTKHNSIMLSVVFN